MRKRPSRVPHGCAVALVVTMTGLCGACDTIAGSSKRPQDASGATPVRYVICASSAGDCHVFARFDDIDSCERHKELSAAYCDRVTTPGRVICDISGATPSTSKGYCLPE